MFAEQIREGDDDTREGQGERVMEKTEDPRAILNDAHRVWFGIERGTHTASDLDRVLDPRRWGVR